MRHARWTALGVALVLLITACGDEDTTTPVFGAQLDPDGRTLTLHLEACNTTEKVAEVTESDTEVRVTVTTKGGSGEETCADLMEVVLADRLGDRPLIDDPTDTEIDVERTEADS